MPAALLRAAALAAAAATTLRDLCPNRDFEPTLEDVDDGAGTKRRGAFEMKCLSAQRWSARAPEHLSETLANFEFV